MSKKVVKLSDKKLHTARLHAEALASDSPSEEARKYFDARLDADPEAWRRHGGLSEAHLAFLWAHIGR